MSVQRESQTLQEWKDAYFVMLRRAQVAEGRARASAGQTASQLEREREEDRRAIQELKAFARAQCYTHAQNVVCDAVELRRLRRRSALVRRRRHDRVL